MNKLPERLKYLESIREELGKLPPDELNEMTDTDSLVEVLKNRVEGLNTDEADERIYEDFMELKGWLENKDSEYACHFILGFFTGTDAESLFSEVESEQKAGYVHAQFPANFKVERANVGLNATCKKMLIAIVPFDGDTFELLELQHKTSASHNKDKLKMSKFDQKKYNGYKIQTTQNEDWKRVEYLLKISGWCVSVMMDNDGRDFDEIPLEPFLETIEIKSEP